MLYSLCINYMCLTKTGETESCYGHYMKNCIVLRTLHVYPLLVYNTDYVHDKDRRNCILLRTVHEKRTLEKTLHPVTHTTHRTYGFLLCVHFRENCIVLRTLHVYPLLVYDTDYVHDKDRINCILLLTLYANVYYSRHCMLWRTLQIGKIALCYMHYMYFVAYTKGKTASCYVHFIRMWIACL